MANPRGTIENLTPIKPGECLNPKGINGYTYRDDGERALAQWCKKHGDEVIERLVKDAARGRGYAMKLVLERILPVVQQHEVHIPGADPAALTAGLDAFFKRRRNNGADVGAAGNGEDRDQ